MASLGEFTTDATVAAIYDAIKAAKDEPPRTYLGASIIGKSCRRALWCDFRWVKQESIDGRLHRLFETGHLAEARFVKNLRDVGVTVLDFDETGAQWGVSFCDGHFRGHADGVALGIKDAPKTWHLLEFKTHADKSFKELVSKGVAAAKPMHYAQMQVYMHGLELSRAYYLAVNKNTDELYGERISYDKDFALSMIERAHSIIYSAEPPLPISDNPAWFECKWCHYHPFCHKAPEQALPDRNCRTCIHASPTTQGGWLCELGFATDIDKDEQLKGCRAHRYIPMLLPSLEFDTYDDETGNVFYRSGTTKLVNDEQGISHV